MTEHFDVLIVGGGPAGLAAAIVLARSNLSVAVCEQCDLPRDKACGEGVMPTGVQHLKVLDALRYLDPRECYPLVGVQFCSAAGHVAAGRFLEGKGLGIRRTNLSRALRQAAVSHPNVRIFEGEAIREIQELDNLFRICWRGQTITSRLLVGADGLNSFVRRWARLEGPRQVLRRLGVRQHFCIAPWSEHVEVAIGRGVEAYVTPCGEQQVGVAFLWDPAVFGQPRQELIPTLMRAFPHLNRRLVTATAGSTPRASGPLYRRATRRTRRGVILIGDAGGYLDACTGEGISLALAQALSLERTVAPILNSFPGMPTARQLAPYAKAWRGITRPYYLGTRAQLYLCRHPGIADRLLIALADHPDIFSHFLSANMGTASFWPGWTAARRLLTAYCSAGRLMAVR